jgi:restriction system protein
MTDMVSFESIPVSGDGSRLLRNRGDSHSDGIVRLLDTMPWWALVVIAILTFLFLHQLAGANVEHVNHAGAMEAAASQVIIKILAGAGQYLFPAILLGEAAGAVIASRRLGPRNTWKARNNTRTVTCVASNVVRADGIRDGLSPPRDREKIREVQRVWSTALLNSMESRRFAALATQYYREKGIRSESMRVGGTGASVLKLFQDNSGKASVVVQFRTQGAPWVGPSQIRALRTVMDSERIEKGLFMTPGAFSKDARECGRVNGVTLVDGKLFLMMIKRLPPAAQRRLLTFATQGD